MNRATLESAAIAIAAEFEKFEAEVMMMGGDPEQAMALVRRHHETGGAEGATGDTIMHRLRQGVDMIDSSRDLVWAVHDVPHRMGGRRHQHMPDGTVRVLTHAVLALALTACGPSLADGGDGFGDTGTGGEIIDQVPPEVLGETVCIEKIPGQTTCWVGWGILDALVKLPCQVDDLVSSGAWSPAVQIDHGDGWGLVRCHQGTVEHCLYSTSNVDLTLQGGVWAPTIDSEVWQFAAVEPPCVDGPCDYQGCDCAGGDCATGLVCDLSSHCSACPAGDPGCPCLPDGTCSVGECSRGTDLDGTSWSICYPADLLGCELSPCPGDAHCTDGLDCAWP